ncbi:MAG: hypothetical protein ACXWLH_01405 [Candidatus Saccharimonadales bacterium]
MYERFLQGFGEEQQAVLHENTVISVLSGLAIRYHRTLEDHTERVARLDATIYDRVPDNSEEVQRTVTAEAPIAFSLEPGNMSASVHVMKVNPETGFKLLGSEIQLGLIGGLSEGGRTNGEFTQEDLALAVERLKAQKQVGILYGNLRDGTGYIKDY